MRRGGSGKLGYLSYWELTVRKMLPPWAMESMRTDWVKLGVRPDWPVM